MARIRFILVMFLLMSTACAEPIPKLTGYVNDFANVLTPQQEQYLTDSIEAMEKSTTVEIAIITVKSTDGRSKAMFTTKIGDTNGVGKASTDNGIVILWSESNERGGFIATGRGIASTLTDAKVVRIGRSSRQYFDAGQHYKGFNTILGGINTELNATTTRYVSTPKEKNINHVVSEELSFGTIVIILLIVLILIFIVIPAVIDFGGGSGSGSFRSSSYIGSSGFGGFSSGDFGGFGGGSFGGGGGSF